MNSRMSQPWTIEYPHDASKDSTVRTRSWIETDSDDGRNEKNPPYSSSVPVYSTQRPLSDDPHKPNPWTPSFWSRFPVTGIAALAGAALLTCAAVAVLVLSDHKDTTSWGYDLKPTVYLSLATALTNILLTYALAEGVVISFWRNAKRGSTLRELNQYWLSGNSVLGALKGSFRGSALIVGLSCVMATLSVARGPLFQAATSVQNVVINSQDQMTVHVAPKLPFQYTSFPQTYTRVDFSDTPAYLSPQFSQVMLQYQNHSDINITQSGCTETCYTSVKAFGFRPICTKKTVKYNYGTVVSADGGNSVQDPVTVFSSNGSYTQTPRAENNGAIEGYYNVALDTIYIANPSGATEGNLVQHFCTLQSGIVDYAITITNNSVTFQSTSWRDDTFISDLHLDVYPNSNPTSGDFIIAGFASAAADLFASSVTMYQGGTYGIVAAFTGLQANQYLKAYPNGTYPTYTEMSWTDPMDDMINAMREIAFRTSIAAASNTSLAGSVQSVPYKGTSSQIVYVTNYTFTIIAAAVSFLGILTVIPTFWGWWEDGREVSMSPLEIAKAFDAPLLAGADGNATVNEIIAQAGGRRVKYGEVVQPGGPEGDRFTRRRAKLAFSDASSVMRPGFGKTYT
jgi:hypothetical protein